MVGTTRFAGLNAPPLEPETTDDASGAKLNGLGADGSSASSSSSSLIIEISASSCDKLSSSPRLLTSRSFISSISSSSMLSAVDCILRKAPILLEEGYVP